MSVNSRAQFLAFLKFNFICFHSTEQYFLSTSSFFSLATLITLVHARRRASRFNAKVEENELRPRSVEDISVDAVEASVRASVFW